MMVRRANFVMSPSLALATVSTVLLFCVIKSRARERRNSPKAPLKNEPL
jgi:hypothetical protein